jgi:hypothetical protein
MRTLLKPSSLALSVGLGIATLAASPAAAQPSAGEWSFGLRGGALFSMGGDVHGGTMAPVPDLGALNPDLAGVAATLDIESRDYDDVYGTMWEIGGEIGYGLSDQGEAFAVVSYTWGNGDQLQVGGAVVPALDTTLPVFGDFDDFGAWGVELGYRHHFNAGGNFRPYIAGRAGLQFVDSINATFTVPDAAITLADVAFYDSSTILTGGLEIGIAYAVGDGVTAGIETGIRYSDGLSDDDSAIGGLGLATINDEGERWSIPLMFNLRVSY